jgi:drug/metabolite transporter (DMT)-like permease
MDAPVTEGSLAAAAPARRKLLAEFELLLVVLIWGANFTFIKFCLEEIPAYTFAALRFSLASICLVALAWHREGPPRIPRDAYPRLIALGIVGNTLYQALFMIGLSRTSVANVAIMVGCSPVLVALLGALTGIERLTRPVAIGALLAFSGITLVVSVHGPEFSTRTLTGDIAVFCASFCWAAYTLGLRGVGGEIPNLWLTALTTIAGVPGLILLGWGHLRDVHWGALSTRAWWSLAYTTLLALVLAYALWNASVRLVGSGKTAIFGAGVPVVAMFLAWPLLGEQPRLVQLIGAACIVGGVLTARRMEQPVEG